MWNSRLADFSQLLESVSLFGRAGITVSTSLCSSVQNVPPSCGCFKDFLFLEFFSFFLKSFGFSVLLSNFIIYCITVEIQHRIVISAIPGDTDPSGQACSIPSANSLKISAW